jgi:hypothetical protein
VAIGENAYAPLRKLFPNDRVSVFSWSSTEEKKAEFRQAKLNEWLTALCHDPTVLTHPKVFPLVEAFFNM